MFLALPVDIHTRPIRLSTKLSREENRFEKDRSFLVQEVERLSSLQRQLARQLEDMKVSRGMRTISLTV